MQTKIVLAVLAIAMSIGFVASNSIIPQASALRVCQGHSLTILAGPGQTVPCVGSQAPRAVPPLRPSP